MASIAKENLAGNVLPDIPMDFPYFDESNF